MNRMSTAAASVYAAKMPVTLASAGTSRTAVHAEVSLAQSPSAGELIAPGDRASDARKSHGGLGNLPARRALNFPALPMAGPAVAPQTHL